MISIEERVIRGFACWAVLRAFEIASCVQPPSEPLLTVERYLRGEASFDDVRLAREKAKGGAVGAGIIGMLRCMVGAALQLAEFHLTDDSPETAARSAVCYAALAAGFAALEKAAHMVELSSAEAQSGWRNYCVAQRAPHINFEAQQSEKRFLEKEYERRLNEMKGGHRES